MDISELYTVELHDKGAEMQVLDQSGKKVDMYLLIVGIDSKKWQNLKNKANRIISNDVTVGEAAKILKEAVIGWRGVESKGNPIDFDSKEVERLLINAPYIIGQIIRFIIDRTNFMKG